MVQKQFSAVMWKEITQGLTFLIHVCYHSKYGINNILYRESCTNKTEMCAATLWFYLFSLCMMFSPISVINQDILHFNIGQFYI